MEETANPQGSESPAPNDVEAAFEDYLKRQADPDGGQGDAGQPAAGAENGQPEGEAKPEPAQDAEAEEQRFKVKINGEEREVPLSELLKGYSLESDYRVKTSQLAEQNRAVQAHAQQVQQMQAQYAQALAMHTQQLSVMQPKAPDPALIQSDPVAFLQQQQAYQAWQQQMSQAIAEQDQLSRAQQADREQAHGQYLAQQYDLMLQAIPEWKDGTAAQTGKKALSDYLTQQGYSADEIAQAVDHRSIVVARKAMLYDQMMAKQADVTKRVANLPPKAPQRPGGGETSPLDGRTRTMQALKKSGSVEDAAHAFAALMSKS